MNRIYYLCLLLWIGPIGATLGQGQTENIPCDLVYLSGLTINRSPVIQRQQLSIDRARADFQMARSTFDYSLRSNVGYDRNRLNLFAADPRFVLANEHLQTNSLNVGGGLQRTFRSGMTANVDLNYSRIADNYPLNEFNQEVGGYLPNNYSSAVFSLSQPLLRGRGRQFAAANEQASRILIEGQRDQLTFVSASELLNMTLTYWQYLASYRSVEIYRENEARVRQMLEVTQVLVEADKKPAGDLIQVQADLTDKERQRVLAEQQLYASRQNLGRYIGLTEEESAQLGVPNNDFPSLEGFSQSAELSQLLALAHEYRADLQSLDHTREALAVTRNLAENQLRPQLDLGGFVGYGGSQAGTGVGRFATALGQQEGRNMQFGVSLNYLFPLNNNLAEANLVAQEVALSDQKVLLDNQIRNIELNVSIAFNNLENSMYTLEKAGQTLAYYEQVFANEQEKFQNGLTTLLNLILFQERLTFAQLDYLSSQQQFANALINLRYETGTLLPEKATQDLRSFYELPNAN